MLRVFVIAIFASLSPSFADDNVVKAVNRLSAIPPNADPEKCYARVVLGGSRRMRTIRHEIHPTYERLDLIPEKFKTVLEEIVVTPEHHAGDILVEKQLEFIVQPASERLMVTQATHKLITGQKKVRGGYTTWKRGKNPTSIIESLGEFGTGAKIKEMKDLKTGEILALVKVPVQFKMVERKVLDTPASVRRVSVAAKTRTVRVEEIIAKSGSGRLIPAETITITKRILVTPANVKRVVVPASYKNITIPEKSSQEPLQWREILCETRLSP